ncbi:MAG: SDR family NAD(P)-dependent oxidoreductase [Fidelibacterota bacterium]
MTNLKDLVCVVTGAGGGVGSAVIGILKDQCHSVIAVFRGNSNAWEKAGNCYQTTANMIDADSVRKIAEVTCNNLGKIHAWVNVVGGFAMGQLIEEGSPEEWERMWRLNFISALNGCRVALPVMKRQKFGRIINFGSVAGLDGMAGAGPYAVSKAAVINLTKNVALEGAPYGVTSNVVVPGIIDTPANRTAMPDADFSQWTSLEAVTRTVIEIIESEHSGKIYRI